jgi:hypothetical protein
MRAVRKPRVIKVGHSWWAIYMWRGKLQVTDFSSHRLALRYAMEMYNQEAERERERP